MASSDADLVQPISALRIQLPPPYTFQPLGRRRSSPVRSPSSAMPAVGYTPEPTRGPAYATPSIGPSVSHERAAILASPFGSNTGYMASPARFQSPRGMGLRPSPRESVHLPPLSPESQARGFNLPPISSVLSSDGSGVGAEDYFGHYASLATRAQDTRRPVQPTQQRSNNSSDEDTGIGHRTPVTPPSDAMELDGHGTGVHIRDGSDSDEARDFVHGKAEHQASYGSVLHDVEMRSDLPTPHSRVHGLGIHYGEGVYKTAPTVTLPYAVAASSTRTIYSLPQSPPRPLRKSAQPPSPPIPAASARARRGSHADYNMTTNHHDKTPYDFPSIRPGLHRVHTAPQAIVFPEVGQRLPYASPYQLRQVQSHVERTRLPLSGFATDVASLQVDKVERPRALSLKDMCAANILGHMRRASDADVKLPAATMQRATTADSSPSPSGSSRNETSSRGSSASSSASSSAAPPAQRPVRRGRQVSIHLPNGDERPDIPLATDRPLPLITDEFGRYPPYNPAPCTVENLWNSKLIVQTTREDGNSKRPMNIFMLFGKYRRHEVKDWIHKDPSKGIPAGQVSAMLSRDYNALMADKELRAPWEELRDRVAKLFKDNNPGYRYTRGPNGSKNRGARGGKVPGTKADPDENAAATKGKGKNPAKVTGKQQKGKNVPNKIELPNASHPGPAAARQTPSTMLAELDLQSPPRGPCADCIAIYDVCDHEHEQGCDCSEGCHSACADWLWGEGSDSEAGSDDFA